MGKPSFRTKSEQEQDEAISHLDEQAAEAHGKFMQLVFDLIDGTHDSSTYEDACRSLLGAPYPDAPSLHSATLPIFRLLDVAVQCLHACCCTCSAAANTGAQHRCHDCILLGFQFCAAANINVTRDSAFGGPAS